jgi:hypothetical protein
MTPPRTHAILSELYRLLSGYQASEFLSAGEYRGTPPNLRDALRALARERGFPAQGRHNGRRSRGGGTAAVGKKVNEDGTILRAILRSARLKTAASVADFAKEARLTIAARPKDSRDRLARRLSQAISAQPEPRRSEIVALLGRSDDQTQGWIDVIKSAKP